MNKNYNECITKCYSEKEGDFIIFHPFLGINYIQYVNDNYCIGKEYSNESSLIKKCNKDDKINNNIDNCMITPIKPHNYLKFYYKLNSIDEIINYIKLNSLLFSSKSRIFDFTFISYSDTIENSIDKWLFLIKACFPEHNNLSDTIIIKIIKKIKINYSKKINQYPLNILLKIKKYLDYNI
jgi:hypothetical protein